MNAPDHWIVWVEPKTGRTLTTKLRRPVELYEESDGYGPTDFGAVRARAARKLRKLEGRHPCARVDLHPFDWSDSIDAA